MSTFSPDGQMQTTWHIRVGATFKKDYVWQTGTPAEPVDLTGWTARAQIREKTDSPEFLLELTTENGCITLGATGEIHVVLEEADTLTLEGLKKGVFDLELVQTSTGYVRNLIGGGTVFYANVTRAE